MKRVVCDAAALIFFVVGALLLVSSAVGQTTATVPERAAKDNPTQTTEALHVQTHTYDDPDLTREVQLGVREKDYVGLVWWIPFEFWEVAGSKRGIPAESTAKNMSALKDYTTVASFIAKVSGMGSFTFVPTEEMHKKIVLRDSLGNEYPSVAEPSQDAKNLAAMMKPLLGAAMGKAGENFDMLFFPARGKNGELIADAKQKGQFSVVLKSNLVGVPESAYEWRTPLTAVAPPKYCPVGGERVHADWDFCPHHGVALNGATK